jgi:hypothetical protein
MVTYTYSGRAATKEFKHLCEHVLVVGGLAA